MVAELKDWRPIKLCPACRGRLELEGGVLYCARGHDTTGATSPQEQFLRSPAFEVCYGGAAGGGKSDALLAGALRYVHLPTYRALLLRREWPELRRTLLARSWEIYPVLGGEWSSTTKTWSFPSGATIELGHAEHEKDVHRYQGAAFQYVGFDELTHFTRSQYVYLISRLRSTDGIPLRLRAATNPGGPGHDWVLERFAPWLYPPPGMPHHDPTYDGPFAETGARLYYAVDDDDERAVEELVPRDYYDPRCEGDAAGVVCAPGAACSRHRPRSRAFIHARVTDNPYLHGTEYEANLSLLDPVTRAQLKHGNWMARTAAGAYFKRAWFDFIDAVPSNVLARVRYWDRAATEDPRADFTAGLRGSRMRDQRFCLEDMVRGQWGPHEVDATIRATAELDRELGAPGVRTVLERDPGQAGKVQARHDANNLAGFDVHMVPPTADKLTRMKPASAQAEARNIVVVRGKWVEPFFRELEDCPNGRWDQIDALSGLMAQLTASNGVKTTTRGSRATAPSRLGDFG